MEILPTSPQLPSTRGPAEWFSGEVWFDVIAAPPAPSRLRCNAVHFTPGARTNWHRHAVGQTLHVTEGVARVGTRDGRVVEVHPGQTIWTPPGEWHWHGAVPGVFTTHLALWETTGDGTPETEWGEPVTDDAHDASPAEVQDA